MKKIITVFIADDSQIVRQRLVAMLSEIKGVQVIGEAKNTSEAISLIHELRPDVIVLDIRMPDGSGIDVLRHIKEEHPASLVIMMTNYPYPQYRKRCMEEKADYFFDKFHEFEKVKSVCSELLQFSSA